MDDLTRCLGVEAAEVGSGVGAVGVGTVGVGGSVAGVGGVGSGVSGVGGVGGGVTGVTGVGGDNASLGGGNDSGEDDLKDKVVAFNFDFNL